MLQVTTRCEKSICSNLDLRVMLDWVD
uniref:Uncharacterized protein n=1 Tax=Nelumbo nucifera TaxID=4432 RepID=A0A822XSR5_NELNU|nr:TPA_asm: hypothetical protein HUJ06_023318 [Nelumbo nucifera]